MLKYANTYSLITGIDPTDPKALISDVDGLGLEYNSLANYLSMYKGQTSIIRYLFVLNEDKAYSLSFTVTSNFMADQFEIQNVIISNIGDNLPCTSKYVTPILLNSSV